MGQLTLITDQPLALTAGPSPAHNEMKVALSSVALQLLLTTHREALTSRFLELCIHAYDEKLCFFYHLVNNNPLCSLKGHLSLQM